MNTKMTSSSVVKLLLVASSLTTSVLAQHQNPNLEAFLEEFHSNPKAVMDQIPVKDNVQQDGLKITVIPESAVAGNAFVAQKDAQRSQICKLNETTGVETCLDSLAGRASILNNDRAEDLVDLGERALKTLGAMDNRNLDNAKLSVRPWSDDYWAIAKGILSYRYADPNKNSGDWKAHTDYVREIPADTFIESGMIDILSPAEKYDLLVGDKNFSLTKKMMDEGRYYYESQGKVESWMGICHGWAPAAYMLDRPTNIVTVKSATGLEIPFYPSDIKSLGSLLWANVRTYTKFSGGRCNTKDPKKDSQSGRIVDQECFDTNPGTWHKSVVNQIGISNRSFIIDATYDYEVWNQPVYSYSYKYFNPQTFQTAKGDYKQAAINVKDFTKDKFKSYRNPKAKKIVGVEMRVEYIAETRPTHREYDNDNFDLVTGVTYRYDLELDGRGKIIGGEWYSNKHPDFLWTPPKSTRALTQLDKQIENAIRSGRQDLKWQSGDALPAIWASNAPLMSQKGEPLGLIVEGLIERSRAAGN